MNKALYAGSFDPFTKGHLNIVKRSLNIFDELHIVLGKNEIKTSFFPVSIKIKMLESIKENLNGTLKNKKIVISLFEDLIYKYALKNEIFFFVRGIKNVQEFEQETIMAEYNKYLSKGKCETIFIHASSKYKTINSSSVKTLLAFKEDVKDFIPESVNQIILKYLKNKK